MKEDLLYEREEKRYLQTILFSRSGLVVPDKDETTTLEDMQPIRRTTHLSAIRHAAETRQKNIARENKKLDQPAETRDLTEAEKLFQESLDKEQNVKVQ